jgi:hypothetical protein
MILVRSCRYVTPASASAHPPDHQPPRLVRGPCGNLDAQGVLPEFLRMDKVNVMLLAVSLALSGIKLNSIYIPRDQSCACTGLPDDCGTDASRRNEGSGDPAERQPVRIGGGDPARPE